MTARLPKQLRTRVADEARVAGDQRPCPFDYDSLPRRDRAWAKERPLYLDIEEANRRDADRDRL